jgi:uncharacterized protein with PQ loop repeat
MLSSFTTQIAFFAALYGVVSALSPALQIQRMRRAGSSASLSRAYILISAGGYLVWLVYGLALGNMPLIVCDAVGAAMQVTVLWWAHRLESPPRNHATERRRSSGALVTETAPS